MTGGVFDVHLELEEARSEIRRHHDLIVKLRDGLAWALDHVPPINLWANDGFPDQAKYEELQTLLRREVG